MAYSALPDGYVTRRHAAGGRTAGASPGRLSAVR